MPGFVDLAQQVIRERVGTGFLSEPFQLHSDDEAVNNVDARLVIASDTATFFQIERVADLPRFALDSSPVTIWIADTTSKVECIPSTTDFVTGQTLLLAKRQPFILGFGDQRSHKVRSTFHGFPRHNSGHFLNESTFRLHFRDRAWSLTFAVQRPGSASFEDWVELGRTIVPSSICTLSPASGRATFKAKQLRQLVSALGLALSFISGSQISPITVIGLSATDAPVWLQIGQGIYRPSKPGGRWSDHLQRRDFETYLDRFFDAFSVETRASTLAAITFLYSECVNSVAGIGASIMLGQTALETLSRTILLNDENLSEDLIARATAADLFDIAVSSLALKKDLVAKACWREGTPPALGDILRGITSARNGIAHGDRDARSTAEVQNCWWSVCRLIEILTLAWIGYTGAYRIVTEPHVLDFGQFYRSHPG